MPKSTLPLKPAHSAAWKFLPLLSHRRHPQVRICPHSSITPSTAPKTHASLKIVYFILAAIVLLFAFNAASSISSAGLNIASIESVGGKTLEEAYYQYSGELYLGYATMVCTTGIFFAAVLAYLGIKG